MAKKYRIKEIFYTLQGEGFHSGRPAVFCRFTACNFWNGREKDREDSICSFCDTDFIGTDGSLGGSYSSEQLVKIIQDCWPENKANKFVVCTGGEPLLQLDEELIQSLHAYNFEIAVESNGSVKAPKGIDWLTISPKSLDHFTQQSGNELKLVFPQDKIQPEDLEPFPFDHYFLQPMDGKKAQENTRLSAEYCMAHPKWKLSLQTHKFIGLR